MRRLVSILPPVVFVAACSSSQVIAPVTDGGADASVTAAKSEYCAQCTPPASCSGARPVSACCVCTAKPSKELQRASGLVYNSAPNNDPTIDLGCLEAPRAQGTSMMVAMSGFVKLFSSGEDSAGVKIEIFQEGANGTLGALVGSTTTALTDAFQMPKPTLLKSCPLDGCTYRAFTIPNVPTETPLIVKTSDASSVKWAPLYDYNVYLANDALKNGMAYFEPTAVAATDLNTVAAAAGGVLIKGDRGLLAGEVHDCADVRLGFALVNTDVPPEGDIVYFGSNEADPVPDTSRATLGTSILGLFGGFNYPTGVPIRISATGLYKGQVTFLGTYTVQAFPKSVTALSLRGRRPHQK